MRSLFVANLAREDNSGKHHGEAAPLELLLCSAASCMNWVHSAGLRAVLS